MSQPWKISSENDFNLLINTQGCNFSKLDCRSVRDKIYYVDGDEVYCQFGLPDDCNFNISTFEVKKIFLNSKNESVILTSPSDKSVSFQVKVEKNLKAIWVDPYFETGEKEISPFYIYWEFENVYSEEEYNKKQSEKVSLTIALLSLSIFSSIVAVNNFKQLLNKK